MFVVDNDDPFLDEGVHGVVFSLVDKKSLLFCCNERLSGGLAITFRKRRPFVKSVDRSIVIRYHMTST